jgi:hypothetical protein
MAHAHCDLVADAEPVVNYFCSFESNASDAFGIGLVPQAFCQAVINMQGARIHLPTNPLDLDNSVAEEISWLQWVEIHVEEAANLRPRSQHAVRSENK